MVANNLAKDTLEELHPVYERNFYIILLKQQVPEVFMKRFKYLKNQTKEKISDAVGIIILFK